MHACNYSGTHPLRLSNCSHKKRKIIKIDGSYFYNPYKIIKIKCTPIQNLSQNFKISDP